jgi:hypothetical protein
MYCAEVSVNHIYSNNISFRCHIYPTLILFRDSWWKSTLLSLLTKILLAKLPPPLFGLLIRIVTFICPDNNRVIYLYLQRSQSLPSIPLDPSRESSTTLIQSDKGMVSSLPSGNIFILNRKI